MEALFDNPIILFILIGLISSIFNRIKGNAQDSQNQRPQRPVHPASQPLDRSRPAETKREPRPVIIENSTEALSDIQKVYLERKQRADKASSESRGPERGRLSTGTTSPRSRLHSEKAEQVINFNPDRNNLIEGVIWSEILGKPRAKKPYSAARRN
ncbi:MAG TPA: hypothetical protein DCR24_14765 [Bacillus bacterium]|nr:hypothetical protein [Bacillus sp. (in: firmicutes)]